MENDVLDNACCFCPRNLVALRGLLATLYKSGITRAFRLYYTFLNNFSFPGASIFTKSLKFLQGSFKGDSYYVVRD